MWLDADDPDNLDCIDEENSEELYGDETDEYDSPDEGIKNPEASNSYLEFLYRVFVKLLG